MTSAGQHLLDLCDDVLARAERAGATACEAFAEYVKQTSASVEQNELKGASSAEHEAVGIRLFVGDRMGFAYVNRFDDESLDEAIADAVAIARASPGDPATGLLDPQPGKVVKGLWDDAIANLPPDEVVRRTAALLDEARGVDARVSVDNASFSATLGHSAVVSTRGVRAAASETAASWGLFGMAVDGDEVGSFDMWSEGARQLKDARTDEGARRFGETVMSLLKPREGKSYKGKVLFSHDAFGEIFLDTLFDAMDGDAVHKGKSRLKGKLGKRVASPDFLVVDDGARHGGLASGAFDREGMPHRRAVLVGDGVLHSFLYDGKAARRAGARPTGHAEGSARSLPSIGTTNVEVGGGSASDEELLRELKDGLWVGRFSGNVDEVSGDFSGVAKGSFLVEKGKRTAPVKETLIAGNVFDMLQRVLAVGRERHRVMATLCPWVLVDGVDVTAGG